MALFDAHNACTLIPRMEIIMHSAMIFSWWPAQDARHVDNSRHSIANEKYVILLERESIIIYDAYVDRRINQMKYSCGFHVK